MGLFSWAHSHGLILMGSFSWGSLSSAHSYGLILQESISLTPHCKLCQTWKALERGTHLACGANEEKKCGALGGAWKPQLPQFRLPAERPRGGLASLFPAL